MANTGLRPFVAIPKDLREWTRWCRDQQLSADDGTVATETLQDGAVTYEKVQEVTADRLLGRLSTDGVLEELTGAQVVSLLEAIDWAFTGDIGFHGAAATGQQTDPGAPSLNTVSGSGDDANINNNFTELESAVNSIRLILNTKGITA